jgi:cell division protein FtsQ
MPLLENVSTRLPVVIGFTSAKRLSAKDSSVLKGIRSLAGFIYYNDFWNAQIGEIVITEDQNFQLIPVIGDHTINIGSAENIEDKLHRLFVFYKQILSKTGFNKYRVLDVRFNGQVVAINKGSGSNIDSAQLKKNIEDLMQKARLQEDNSGMLSEEGIISVNVDTAGKEHQSLSVPAKTDSIERYVNQNISKPKKTAKGSKITEKTTIEPKRTGLKKPKAVMKKRAH